LVVVSRWWLKGQDEEAGISNVEDQANTANARLNRIEIEIQALVQLEGKKNTVTWLRTERGPGRRRMERYENRTNADGGMSRRREEGRRRAFQTTNPEK
jgi:hypothetical protein